ncbi:MAG: peptidoglycan-binding domain-containing protein [Patescibacteria group bacterium]
MIKKLFLLVLIVGAVGAVSFAKADVLALYRELSLGMTGKDVSVLQTFLAKDKTIYPTGQVTGKFGPQTKSAVANFQSKNGLPAVGRAGPKTIALINSKINGSSAAAPAPIVPAPVSSLPDVSTLSVKLVPLLAGGVAHLGSSVPVAYLQVSNVGKQTATLNGFYLNQSGSLPTSAVIGFTALDDKGIQHGTVGGAEGFATFVYGKAFAPASTVFAPGETKLFTIRATLSANASYIGGTLVLNILSVDTNVSQKGAFPIAGTTWTVAK